MRAPPCDVRGFIHKRIIGFAKGFITGGGPIGGVVGALIPGGRGDPGCPGTQVRVEGVCRPTPDSAGGCPVGFIKRGDVCMPILAGEKQTGLGALGQRLIPGGETGRFEFGEAIMGRYGPALVPAGRALEVSVCPPGAILGNDGLCYNRGTITNRQRKWPRGRRPLLTGGDMRCISIAAAAAKKLQGKQKQLQALGMLKTPTRRPKALIAAGHHAHVAHN